MTDTATPEVLTDKFGQPYSLTLAPENWSRLCDRCALQPICGEPECERQYTCGNSAGRRQVYNYYQPRPTFAALLAHMAAWPAHLNEDDEACAWHSETVEMIEAMKGVES